jgi:tRNA pseudouridine55 synthase
MEPSRGAGVLPVDKPVGPTSHDVVAAARRALRTRRIGHTGTLDPFASGLLLLCVGEATRIAEFLTGLPKTYRARMRFGAATDTDDRTGQVVARSEEWRALTPARITDVLARLTGEVDQVPPIFSAKKVGGVAMHRLARSGAAPTPAAVRVRIHEIRLLDVALPEAEIEITCSAGTYVRAVARDAGAALGTFAHLAELRRTRVGRFSVEQAIGQEALELPDAVERAWLSPLQALEHLPQIEVDAVQAAAIAHGGTIAAPVDAAPGNAVALAHEAKLLAIAEPAHGRLQPRKVFAP